MRSRAKHVAPQQNLWACATQGNDANAMLSVAYEARWGYRVPPTVAAAGGGRAAAGPAIRSLAAPFHIAPAESRPTDAAEDPAL